MIMLQTMYSGRSVLKRLQYFTQFGHMAELSESELVLQKRANVQAE
jgi:hypothetical protein